MTEQERIDRMIDHLYEGEYSPSLPANVKEAMGALSDADAEEITELRAVKDWTEIGRFTDRHIEHYWLKRSEQDAPERLEREIETTKREIAADRQLDRRAA